MHTIKKKETPLVFYNIFFSLEVKLGVILLDYWHKLSAARYFLTDIQIPKSTKFFAYFSPSIHISKLIFEQKLGNRALHNEICLNAMSCDIPSSENKSGSAA